MTSHSLRLDILSYTMALGLAVVVPAFGQDKSLWFSERWPPTSPPASSPIAPPSGKPAVRPSLPGTDNILILIRTSLLTAQRRDPDRQLHGVA